MGGNYGKKIREAFGHDEENNTVNNDKTLNVPTASLTSWTIDPEMAKRFAHSRGHIEGQPDNKGAVMSKWIPVKNVLHSGMHSVIGGQEHPHADEQEIVVGHETGKIPVSHKNLSFQSKDYDFSKPQLTNDSKLAASEDDVPMELLQKSMKRAITVGMASAMLGIPGGISKDPKTMSLPVTTISRHEFEHKAHPDLKAIKMIESSGGINTKHAEVKHGQNAGTSAIGSYGLMPLQVQDTIKADPTLKSKYGHVLDFNPKKDQDKIHAFVGSDKNIENELVNSHWKRLGKIFHGDKNKMAHAWYEGITGTKSASDDAINHHPYVVKFNKYSHLKGLETNQRNHKVSMNKSEADKQHITRFVPTFNDPSQAKYINEINESIRNKNTHDLSSVGHFTHSSFVVGSNQDSAWLIKVEPTNRPGVDSAKSGLQSNKEAAFSEAASKVFRMGNYTQYAILGSVDKDGHKWPAVAIRMYPERFVSAVDFMQTNAAKLKSVFLLSAKSGLLAKLADMMYVLGEADSHGHNLLTDGTTIKSIDHGTSFADISFDPHADKNIFIPYFLRSNKIKDNMSDEEKYQNMPTADDESREELKTYINSINQHLLLQVLNKYHIDAKPVLVRLKMLQTRVNQSTAPDLIINHAWIYGLK